MAGKMKGSTTVRATIGVKSSSMASGYFTCWTSDTKVRIINTTYPKGKQRFSGKQSDGVGHILGGPAEILKELFGEVPELLEIWRKLKKVISEIQNTDVGCTGPESARLFAEPGYRPDYEVLPSPFLSDSPPH